MPPCLDIYALTKHRKLELIERFLNEYVDRNASEDRGDEDLMILKIGASSDNLNADDSESYEWEPAKTLTSVIQRGLVHPRRCFRVYLKPCRAEIYRAILSFTADDQLILGISIDDEEAGEANKSLAKDLLIKLAANYDCHLGLIAAEYPPPTNETNFLAESKNPHLVHFKDFRAQLSRD